MRAIMMTSYLLRHELEKSPTTSDGCGNHSLIRHQNACKRQHLDYRLMLRPFGCFSYTYFVLFKWDSYRKVTNHGHYVPNC